MNTQNKYYDKACRSVMVELAIFHCDNLFLICKLLLKSFVLHFNGIIVTYRQRKC